MAERLNVIYVKGKRKRRVPILFTEEMSKGVDRLLGSRKAIGVSELNLYLFPRATKGSFNSVKAWDVINDITESCPGLQKPELINSTKVRKEVATVLQLLDMNEAELSWVTDHLGHSKDVHKTWYRQEASTVELTHVAQLLMAKDRGDSFRNKQMSEITGLYLLFNNTSILRYFILPTSLLLPFELLNTLLIYQVFLVLYIQYAQSLRSIITLGSICYFLVICRGLGSTKVW